MTGFIQTVEGIWDDALDGVRRAVEQVATRIHHRHEQEQQVTQLTQGSGSRFRIEPEQVPQVIADLDEALIRVQGIRVQAEAIASTMPPGYDEISSNATSQIGQMAMGSEGSLRAALDAYEQEIVKTKDKLRVQLQTYLGTEQLNVPPAAAWSHG